VPIHCEGWTHYTQDTASLAAAFAAAGLAEVLAVVPAGARCSSEARPAAAVVRSIAWLEP
jgi:hypothetical protein